MILAPCMCAMLFWGWTGGPPGLGGLISLRIGNGRTCLIGGLIPIGGPLAAMTGLGALLAVVSRAKLAMR